jgi:hypothetical protein
MKLRAKAESPDGEKFDLSEHAGKHRLVFYEDKDVRTQNQPLKEKLWESMEQRQRKDELMIIAVANVSAFNWWPAKKVVAAAIREEVRKLGAPIWCDWDGSFGREIEATKGVSNVLLLGKEGTVLFKHAGAVSPEQIQSLLKLLPD